MGRGASAKTKADANEIVNVVKTLGSATYSDICTLTGIPEDRVKSICRRYITKNFPQIKRYIRTNPTGQGGSVSTLVYETVRMADARYDFNAGEIWNDNSTIGARYLILSSFKDSLCCLMVKNLDNTYDPAADIAFRIDETEYYISPYKVLCKPVRVMVNKSHDRVDKKKLDKIKEAVASCLGLTMAEPVEKIVEKEVRVEVPVPVQKIVEKEVPVEKIVYVDRPGNSSGDEVLKYKASMWDKYVENILTTTPYHPLTVQDTPSITWAAGPTVYC